ncbi:cytoplasmic protein [Candidatus Marinamargulisbacteria bacterium SCGC AAA071-K20]|nr:cytoplasmic protein [Candidatus Marinamargulisbacteria bacterium SCGC AAA071-K20]
MEIPYQQLTKEALRSLITDFVCSVDDYDDYSLDSKIEQVTHQLKKGTIVITFNDKDETCLIQTREMLRKLEKNQCK